MNPQKAALTVEESCSYIGVSRPTFYRLMAQGAIPSFLIGRRRLTLKEHLDMFLRRQLAEAGYPEREGV